MADHLTWPTSKQEPPNAVNMTDQYTEKQIILVSSMPVTIMENYAIERVS
jgi:hypothetical protein